MNSIHDPRYVEVVAQIRVARKSMGLSQSDLGMRIGRKQSWVSKVETFERRIDIIETLDICEALGISIAEIVPSSLRRLIVGQVQTGTQS